MKKGWRKTLKAKLEGDLWHNVLLFIGGVAVLGIALITLWVASFRIPDFHSFEDRKVSSSTQIFDRTGKILLYDLHQDVKRTNVSFEEMSPYIKNATVAIEDADFYNHGGIKVSAIFRAVLYNLTHTGSTQGGSTITQQLVKNTLLTKKKALSRKIKEWFLAIKIDNSMPKEKILEYYLNEAPYGGPIYGIEEASQSYFSKRALDLTLAESAYLAAIPQSPTTLSPYGKNRQRLDDRKNLVLARMKDLKFISEEEYEQAKNEVVQFAPQATNGIKAPHFVFFIKNYLEERFGQDVAQNGGFKVTTTIDYDLQQKAQEIVREGALINERDWNGENASLVAIDPKTGQILTMVGSRDYFDKEIDGNYNIATALRQPGSSFKPFVYAGAFEKGYTPDTVLFDLPTEFNTSCSAYSGGGEGCYTPHNFDDKFRGPMTLKSALAESINVPAVKLLYLVGLKDAITLAESMGISSLTDPSRYGLSLVIGGGEVTLLDMTSAYSVFANNGVRNPYTGILKIEDSRGRVVEEFAPHEKQVLPKNTALKISYILSDNGLRAPTFGSVSALHFPGFDVAAKTGTTNSNRDAWTMGYSPSIAVGVWAGNNDNTPMKKGGVAMAGPIFNKFMNFALQNLPREEFEEPDLYVDPEVSKPILNGDWRGGGQGVHTILYYVDKNNVLGPAPEHPEDDPQFSHWEIPVQNWWGQNNYGYPSVYPGTDPLLPTQVPTPSPVPTDPNNPYYYYYPPVQ